MVQLTHISASLLNKFIRQMANGKFDLSGVAVRTFDNKTYVFAEYFKTKDGAPLTESRRGTLENDIK